MIFFLLSLWKQGLEFSRALGMGRGARAVWEAKTEDLWNFPNCVPAKTRSQEAGERKRVGLGPRDPESSPGHSLLRVLEWRWHSPVLCASQCPTCELGMTSALSSRRGRSRRQRDLGDESICSEHQLEQTEGAPRQRPPRRPAAHPLLTHWEFGVSCPAFPPLSLRVCRAFCPPCSSPPPPPAGRRSPPRAGSAWRVPPSLAQLVFSFLFWAPCPSKMPLLGHHPL